MLIEIGPQGQKSAPYDADPGHGNQHCQAQCGAALLMLLAIVECNRLCTRTTQVNT